MTDGIKPHSTHEIVQEGLDQARQTLFSAADVPLASADELLAAVTSAAVKAVLEARIEQMVRHGHSAATDDQMDLRILPSNARTMILNGIDLLGGPNRNPAVARKRFARGAAMMLAAIDQIDRAVAASSSSEGDGA